MTSFYKLDLHLFLDSADALPHVADRLHDGIETGDHLHLPVPGLVHPTAVRVETIAVTAVRRRLLLAERKTRHCLGRARPPFFITLLDRDSFSFSFCPRHWWCSQLQNTTFRNYFFFFKGILKDDTISSDMELSFGSRYFYFFMGKLFCVYSGLTALYITTWQFL